MEGKRGCGRSREKVWADLDMAQSKRKGFMIHLQKERMWTRLDWPEIALNALVTIRDAMV